MEGIISHHPLINRVKYSVKKWWGQSPYVPMRSGGPGAPNARLNRSEHLGAKRNHVVGLCSPHADKREGSSINKIETFKSILNLSKFFKI